MGHVPSTNQRATRKYKEFVRGRSKRERIKGRQRGAKEEEVGDVVAQISAPDLVIKGILRTALIGLRINFMRLHIITNLRLNRSSASTNCELIGMIQARIYHHSRLGSSNWNNSLLVSRLQPRARRLFQCAKTSHKSQILTILLSKG